MLAKRTRREFWTLHPLAEIPLRGWSAEASKAVWWTPADIKTAHRRASFLANNRVVFNIKGNDYRLVVALTVSVPAEPTAAMHELARAIAPVSGSGIGVRYRGQVSLGSINWTRASWTIIFSDIHLTNSRTLAIIPATAPAARSLVRTADPTDRGLIVGSAVRRSAAGRSDDQGLQSGRLADISATQSSGG